MRQDRDRCFVDTDARDGEEPAVTAPEAGALPHVTEHEVEDARVLVRRVATGRRHEVHVAELLLAASDARLPVVGARAR